MNKNTMLGSVLLILLGLSASIATAQRKEPDRRYTQPNYTAGTSTAQTFTSTAGSGVNGFQCTTNGCRLDLGTGSMDDLYSDGTSIGTPGGFFADNVRGFAGSGGNALAVVTTGARLDVGAGTTDYLFSDGTGVLTPAGGYFLAQGNAYVNATLFARGDIQNTTASQPVTIADAEGLSVSGPIAITSDSTLNVTEADSSGTPGAATCNKPKCKAALATGSASLVITNSLVTTASHVACSMQEADATCTQLLRVVPAAGSYTITCNGVATGNPDVSCLVTN